MTRFRVRTTLIGIGLAMVLVAGCAGSETTDTSAPDGDTTTTEAVGGSSTSTAPSETTSTASEGGDYPEANSFPEEIFGDLSGEIIFHDNSGGAADEARMDTIFANFTEFTGVPLQSDFNADMSVFFATMEGGQDVPWSLVEFGAPESYLRAKSLDLLEEIDTDVVPTGLVADDALDSHGVYAHRYSANLAYNTDVYPDPATAPATLEDIFDTERFPGTRCMLQYPQYGGTLEAALLADGVAPDDLYPLDVDRALAKLDTIKDDIVWWGTAEEGALLLTTGECDLGTIYNGRAYNVAVTDGAPIKIVWGNAVYNLAVYAVPKGAPNPEAGQAAISWFLRDLEGQRDYVARIPYASPINPLDEAGYAADLEPWLASGENLEASIREDAEYYAENIAEIVDAFNRWVASS